MKLNFSFFNVFKKKDKSKKSGDKEKNVVLTGDSMRVHIFRLINNSPVESAIVEAQLVRDNNNNTIIFDEEISFKEELPGIQDSLISDVLYKLESRGLSVSEQVVKVKKNIELQEDILKNEKQGYVMKGTLKVMVNFETEKAKLRLLKCVEYTLVNKKGAGYFESIEVDGTRSLSYVIRDGELIPYWYKTPESNSEPVMLVPDIAQRKKFYKDTTEEAINDFNESQDTMWKGWLGWLTKLLYIILALALIGGNIYTLRIAGDLNDESLQHDVDALKVENERIRQQCSSQVANQIENNDVLIDYAKGILEGKIADPKVTNIDKSNINI